MKRDLKEAMGGLEERVRAGLHELEGQGERARTAVKKLVKRARREVKSETRVLEGEFNKASKHIRAMVDEAMKGSLDTLLKPTRRAIDESRVRLEKLERKIERMSHKAPARRAAARPRIVKPKRAAAHA